jgi:heme-degrading monooxygenase HmoA
MFSVIFEVNRKPERAGDYLVLAKHLKPILEKIDGFIDNERFANIANKGWLLSHSTWRDEKAVIRWRTEAQHHQVQKQGRSEIFYDYHLRVGEIVIDTAPPASVPIRELRFDETDTAPAKYATLTEMTPKVSANFANESHTTPARLGLDPTFAGLIGKDIFASINSPGKLAVLASWKDAQSARSWTPKSFDGVQDFRHRVVRIIRDYGMFDRREAPQFYPAVQKSET